MTYSRDFRSKVIDTREKENLSMAEAAKRFGVGLISVLRWSKNIESITKRNKPATKIDMEALKQDVEKYPDAYQYERAERLGVSEGCVFHALKRLNVTYKMQHPKADKEKRSAFCEEVKKYKEQSRPLVFIDDSRTTCHVHMDMPLKVLWYSRLGSQRSNKCDWSFAFWYVVDG